MNEYYNPYFEKRIHDVGSTIEKWYEGHSENCSFGGLGCLYWIADSECKADHPMIHAHAKEARCPGDH